MKKQIIKLLDKSYKEAEKLGLKIVKEISKEDFEGMFKGVTIEPSDLNKFCFATGNYDSPSRFYYWHIFDDVGVAYSNLKNNTMLRTDLYKIISI